MARAGDTFIQFVPPVWGARASFVLAAILVLASLSTSRDASAHDIGLSRGEYTWQSGKVLVAATFARRDLSATLPWLASSDAAGLVVFEEQRVRLGEWLVARLAMATEDGPCKGSFDGMRFDGDGVALALAYTCPVDPEEVRIDARFVSELGRGHRHLASLEHGDQHEDVVATAENVSFIFRVLGRARPGASNLGLWAYVRLGVEHILTGYDHLLFLVGLVLLGRPIRSLVGA